MHATTLTQLMPGIAAITAYLVSAALLWQASVVAPQRGSSKKRSLLIGGIAGGGAALHLIMLHGTAFDTAALNFSFFNSLSVTAWFTVLLLLVVSLARPVLTLGLIVFPASAVLVGLAMAFVGSARLTVDHNLQWHVLISIVAYALLTMAAVQSSLVSLQDKRLRDHRPGGLLRALPSLKLMEQVLLQLLIASFLLLALALATGIIFVDDLFAQRLVHKTALSILALVLLALLLIGHFRFGWRGQKAAKMTLCAYAALVLGYFGSKFVKEVLLGG